MPNRSSALPGCFVLTVPLLLGYIVLAPAFREARAATLESRRFDDGARLARALRAYAEGHRGHLPGGAWTSELERVDPGLVAQLYRDVDGRQLGWAAITDALGRPLGEMPPEQVLFVESRSGRTNEIARDLSTLGGRLQRGTAVAITVENVRDRSPVSMTPLVRIGMQLQRQRAPGLR